MVKKEKKLSDIANELGLSITTVSRAISGKGRTSQATRNTVNEYIKKNGFALNKIASALAKGRTLNICALMPEDEASFSLPFFQKCLLGITEEASKHDYDVIVASVSPKHVNQLKRLLASPKADGYLVLRSIEDDPTIDILKESGKPFVLIGSSNDQEVVQIDADNEEASYSLALALKEKVKKASLILGPTEFVTNKSREKGILKAINCQVYKDKTSYEDIEEAVVSSQDQDCNVIIAGDDSICANVINCLRERDSSYKPIVASLYDNGFLDLLGNVEFKAQTTDAKTLGSLATERLIGLL